MEEKCMVKKLTTFKIDEATWMKFEKKRYNSINLKEKYATMNKSRILNNLVKDYLAGKIVIDLATPEKYGDKVIQQAFHMDMETFVAFEKKLMEEKLKHINNIEAFYRIGTKNNAIIKLIKNYIKG